MMMGHRIAALALTLGLGLTGCGATAEEGSAGVLRNLLLFGGTTVPPAAELSASDAYCPPIAVLEGGAAIQPSSGRHQVTLGRLARECVGQPDGSTLVTVGVEARALLGAGGSAGRYDVPVRIVVTHAGRVLADRVRRGSITIPPGEVQGSLMLVEEGILVPPQSAEAFAIRVGLGAAAAGRPRG